MGKQEIRCMLPPIHASVSQLIYRIVFLASYPTIYDPHTTNPTVSYRTAAELRTYQLPAVRCDGNHLCNPCAVSCCDTIYVQVRTLGTDSCIAWLCDFECFLYFQIHFVHPTSAAGPVSISWKFNSSRCGMGGGLCIQKGNTARGSELADT